MHMSCKTFKNDIQKKYIQQKMYDNTNESSREIQAGKKNKKKTCKTYKYISCIFLYKHDSVTRMGYISFFYYVLVTVGA